MYQCVKISLQKSTYLKKELLVAASYRKIPVLESIFSSEYWENLKSLFLEEHLRTSASENVIMKLRKNKIYKEF